MQNAKGCACPYCETELKKGCMKPGFCKSCAVKKNIKICGKCKAEYGAQYDECPSCAADKK